MIGTPSTSARCSGIINSNAIFELYLLIFELYYSSGIVIIDGFMPIMLDSRCIDSLFLLLLMVLSSIYYSFMA